MPHLGAAWRQNLKKAKAPAENIYTYLPVLNTRRTRSNSAGWHLSGCVGGIFCYIESPGVFQFQYFNSNNTYAGYASVSQPLTWWVTPFPTVVDVGTQPAVAVQPPFSHPATGLRDAAGHDFCPLIGAAAYCLSANPLTGAWSDRRARPAIGWDVAAGPPDWPAGSRISGRRRWVSYWAPAEAEPMQWNWSAPPPPPAPPRRTTED